MNARKRNIWLLIRAESDQARPSQAGHFYFGTVLLLLNKKLCLKIVLFQAQKRKIFPVSHKLCQIVLNARQDKIL